MIDVTDRSTTLRRATAEALVTMRPETATAARQGHIPKGDVAEMTRAVAMLGLKRTPDLLPFCHRIPVEHASVRVAIEEAAVRVTVEVASIARTGVEVEAMTGATVGALNVYDMVKPIDPDAAIGRVSVVSKSGGRSEHRPRTKSSPRAGVLVVSDSVAAGRKTDRAGAAVRASLEAHGVDVAAFQVLPDDPEAIADRVRRWVDDDGLALVFAVGGTGLGPRDRTPEAVLPLLEREIPGVSEAIRGYGRERTPYAALSRSVAGQRGRSILLALPGSSRGASESMDAVMPWLLHLLEVVEAGFRHGE